MTIDSQQVVHFQRDGCLVSTICSDEQVLRALTTALSYDRQVYQHPTWELKQAGIFDKIRHEHIECYTFIDDPDEVLERQLVFAAGYLPRVAAVLKQLGRRVKVQTYRRCGQKPGETTSVFDAPDLTRLDPYEWRWMQREAITALCSKEYGRIKCPTGWGKSFTIAGICHLFPKAQIAISTHSVDVLSDIYDNLRSQMPEVGIVSGKHKRPAGRVVCYSGKSLHNCPRADLLLCDEIHEWGSEDYLRIAALPAFHYARKYGLSASVGERPDDADFEVEGSFGPMLVDLPYEDCVKHGCVVPIEVHWRDVTMNSDPAALEQDPVSKERLGIWTNDYRNRLIAEDARSFAADEQVLICVKTIEHAMHLKKQLPEFAMCYSDGGLDARDRAAYVRQGFIQADEPVMTQARRDMLKKRFETGELKKAIANSVWNRGVNFRALRVLIRADAQASPIADRQIPGRTSRICDETGKEVSMIIDYRDQFNPTFRGRAAKRLTNYKSYGWRQVAPDKSKARLREALAGQSV